MREEKPCPTCGGIMKKEIDTDEPLVVYRCLDCNKIEFERINGYEG